MSLVLGLDLSTQSLSALAFDMDSGELCFSASVSFEADLPQYQSPNGVLPHENPLRHHANPLMWVDALELLFTKMKADGFDLSRVQAMSGAAQQHGTVYLKQPLNGLDDTPTQIPLSQKLRPYLSRETSPLWMDTSTSAACAAFSLAAGGPRNVRRLSGSAPEARFAAAQIRAFSESEANAYGSTGRIHLVSSFLSSLLIGRDAPLDLSDALGMNLVNLNSRDWDDTLLDATAPSLRDRLPELAASHTLLGPVSRTLQEKYGFAPQVPVYICTGDNPSSLVGTGATSPGQVVISLGTSDTIMACTEQPNPAAMEYGHIFGNPWGDTFALICFANGSLARERVAARLGGDWKRFEEALQTSPPGNNGQRMLPYFFPEITPEVEATGPWLFGNESFRTWRQPEATARAIVEAQAVLMRHYSRKLIESPRQLTLTGGASQNRAILQIFADVFQAPVKTLTSPGSVALGAALRATHAQGNTLPEELFATFVNARIECQPNESTRSIYDALEVQLLSDQQQAISLSESPS